MKYNVHVHTCTIANSVVLTSSRGDGAINWMVDYSDVGVARRSR